MSSMGYGNSPVAHSTSDMIYSICVQVVGACLAAGIFSNVAQMINQSDLKNVRYQAQLDRACPEDSPTVPALWHSPL